MANELETNELISTPFSQTAEISVLGAMLINKESIGVGIQMGLTPNDFYLPANKELYIAMLDLYNAEVPIDITTLQAKLEEKGVFEQIGGLPFLAEVATSVATSSAMPHHAKIVIDRSTRRKIIGIAEDIAKAGRKADSETQSILDFAEQRIFDILENKNTQDFDKLPDILAAMHADLKEILNGKPQEEGIVTGFSDLDRKLTGLMPGQLILIAARPAMGKTSFAMNIAMNVARVGKTVAVFSLEMTKQELANRIWSSESFVELSKIHSINFDDKDWKQLSNAVKMMNTWNLFVDDSGGVTVTEMSSKCRRLKRETKHLDLVIIDHMQLMQSGSSRRGENRQQEVSEISRSLKLMAKRLGIPVIVLSQLNRNPEGRAKNRPALSDLRESGAIEQDADVVTMLYREDYYDENAKPNIAEVIIAKNRSGPTGTVKLSWSPEFTSFHTVDGHFDDSNDDNYSDGEESYENGETSF